MTLSTTSVRRVRFPVSFLPAVGDMASGRVRFGTLSCSSYRTPLYDYYGESRSIERLYPTMLRYLDYLKTKEKDGYLPFGLGDWVY